MLYKNKYRIESARLKNWDYSSDGYYFITICTRNRVHFFGTITNGIMVLSDMGNIADRFWREIPDHFPMVRLDKWVIMPNHVHGIVFIDNKISSQNPGVTGIPGVTGRDKALPCLYGTNGSTNRTNTEINSNTPSRFQNQGKGTISAIIGSYKSICTKTINKSTNTIRFAWQPRYHDHIIRNNDELIRIQEYIVNNPMNWNIDDLQC